MRFALFKEVPRRQRRKKRKLNDGGASRKDREGSDEDTDASGDEFDPVTERMSMPPAAPIDPPAIQHDPIWGNVSQDSQNVQMEINQPPAASGPPDDERIRPDR